MDPNRFLWVDLGSHGFVWIERGLFEDPALDTANRTCPPGHPLDRSWIPGQPLEWSGHVQSATFHEVSHVSGLEMRFQVESK